MDVIQIDWRVVIIAAVLNMVIGFFWYSKWLFGTIWAKMAHLSQKKFDGKNMAIVYQGIISLVIAFFLAFFETYLGVTTVTDGMFVGFCAWLGFVATTQIGAVIWTDTRFKLFLIDTGGKLLSFLVMGGIIGA